MKRKFVIFVGGIALMGAVAVNFSLNANNGTLSDFSLANIEALAGCEATANKCSVSCTGDMYCFSYDDSVNCDGNHKSC